MTAHPITADLAPASAKERCHEFRTRDASSARVPSARPRRTRARAGAERARRAGASARAIERCQFRALTAFVPSRDERSSPGCGVAGDPRPGSVFLVNQTEELRS